MELQPGDWVRTETGEAGKVLHISRLTLFVVFAVDGKTDRVLAYLESELTKVEPPIQRASDPS